MDIGSVFVLTKPRASVHTRSTALTAALPVVRFDLLLSASSGLLIALRARTVAFAARFLFVLTVFLALAGTLS